MKNTCSRNTTKNLSHFINFPTNIWLVSEETLALLLFLDAQEVHSWSALKANVCIFLHISLRKLWFQRRRKILSAFIFYLLNNFLKEACCLGLANILQFFILTEIFGNSTIFHHFDNSITILTSRVRLLLRVLVRIFMRSHSHLV